MNLSMKWLNDFVDMSDTTTAAFCHGMTMSGSKVEGFEQEDAQLDHVVVGKILEKKQHENADALFVCQVEIGAEAPIQIVTNAKNVQEGDLVPVALEGANLPDGTKIKKGKLRGVESFGMFCGLETFHLTTHDFPNADPESVFILNDEGCSVGQPLSEAIGLNDTSVEFEITSNRPDCLSVIGLAREAAVTFGKALNIPTPKYNANSENVADTLSVSVENATLCPRYCAGMVKNVKIGPSPRWMRERLRASGVRPINNLVDITNYVMLEYGHPMHAFDLRYVEGNQIVVRNAKEAETITTLDGVERTLSPEMLVIADAKKPIAVAGVMGGEFSGIMDDTTTVVFESAYFEPVQVRRTAKKLGMRTDASSRYEKGLDPEATTSALSRAFELVEQLGAGEVVGGMIDCYATPKECNRVPFSAEWINNFIGIQLSESEMKKILSDLSFGFEGDNVVAPSFRIDIECKADVAEEVARIYGYNNIPSTELKGIADAQLTAEQKFERDLENTVVSLGCNEIATFSFISPKYFDKIQLPADSKLRKTVTITNPLGEDTSVMRTTILPSMMEILAKNYSNRNAEAKLFELGKEYIPTTEETLPEEPQRLVIGMYGSNCDFYDLKGIIETILQRSGIDNCDFARFDAENPYEEAAAFHPYRSAYITKDGKAIGYLGQIHPTVCETYGIDTEVYCAKLDVDTLFALSQTEITYKPLPKYPAVTRDLSVVCDDDIPAASLERAIKNAVGKILEEVKLFDVYKGKQIEEGKKSISYAISMRSLEGTLTDEQAEGAMKRVLKALKELGAELRS